MSGDFVDATHARSEDYAQDLAEIQEAGVCPFCPETFRWHPHPIIARRGTWLITRNREPYKNAKDHFLVIGERHMESLSEMDPADIASVLYLAYYVTGSTGGGGLVLRFGDPVITGATVRHLHFHVIVPQIDSETGRAKTVSFPIG